jgi:hypothetical protein
VNRFLPCGVALLALLLMAQAPAPTAPGGGAPSPSPADTWLPRGTAELVLLDKLRGQPVTVSVKSGQSTVFGALTITVRNCATRPPDLPQNAAAFLEVAEGKTAKPVFKGWVLSNTPAVGQLEDPVYDLRLVTCR